MRPDQRHNLLIEEAIRHALRQRCPLCAPLGGAVGTEENVEVSTPVDGQPTLMLRQP